MPQEFQVLRCFLCQTFQVHQVKKAKKWNCKVCGEKQSILKVFGRGTGLECRGHTQKLNRSQGEVNDSVDLRTANEHDDQGDSMSPKCKQDILASSNVPDESGTNGRWSQYIAETNREDTNYNQSELSTDFSIYTTDWNQYKAANKHARVNRLSSSRNGKRKICCKSESHQSNFCQKSTKMSRLSSQKLEVTPAFSKTYSDETDKKYDIKFDGSGGMDLTCFGNEPNLKKTIHSTANFERYLVGNNSTNHNKKAEFVQKFGKLCNASYSSKELDNARDNEGTKASQYGINKSTCSTGTSDYSNAASYQQFDGKSSHDLESDLSKCYGTENLRNVDVTCGKLKQLDSTDESEDCAYYQRSTPKSVVNDRSVNMTMNSNSNLLRTDISTRTRDQNVNSGPLGKGLVVKKLTNKQNSISKSTAANANFNSKWGKFLSNAQESSDECSQGVEFEQQNLNGKYFLQDKVNLNDNSYIPFPSYVSSVKNCHENISSQDSDRNIDAVVSNSNCSSLVIKCTDLSGKLNREPDIKNMFSLDDSDEENTMNFAL